MRLYLLIAFACMFPFLVKGQASVTEAERLFSEEKFDSALQVYEKLVEQYPDTLTLHYNRGLCFYHLGKWDNALANFNFCIEADSFYAPARFMRATVLEQKGDKEAALAELQQLENISPSYDNVAKRIKIYEIAVYVSRNWYYMLAMAFLLIVLMATVATLKASRKV